MGTTHQGKVPMEISIGGAVIELVADIGFAVSKAYPATIEGPAEGGNVEITAVNDIWEMEIKPIKQADGTTALTSRKVIHGKAPEWLAAFVIEHADAEDLREQAADDGEG